MKRVVYRIKNPYAHRGLWRTVLRIRELGFANAANDLECGHHWVGLSAKKYALRRRCNLCLEKSLKDAQATKEAGRD